VIETKKYKYVYMKEIEQDSKRKTKIYKVYNKRFGKEIGIIKWGRTLKQYCFCPSSGTEWKLGYLLGITCFLEELMDLRIKGAK